MKSCLIIAGEKPPQSVTNFVRRVADWLHSEGWKVRFVGEWPVWESDTVVGQPAMVLVYKLETESEWSDLQSHPHYIPLTPNKMKRIAGKVLHSKLQDN